MDYLLTVTSILDITIVAGVTRSIGEVGHAPGHREAWGHRTRLRCEPVLLEHVGKISESDPNAGSMNMAFPYSSDGDSATSRLGPPPCFMSLVTHTVTCTVKGRRITPNSGSDPGGVANQNLVDTTCGL